MELIVLDGGRCRRRRSVAMENNETMLGPWQHGTWSIGSPKEIKNIRAVPPVIVEVIVDSMEGMWLGSPAHETVKLAYGWGYQSRLQ